MKEWRETELGEFVQTISKTYKFGNKEKVIFLNTGDILDGKFLVSHYSSVNTLPGQAKKSIQKGDILYSEIRPANKRYAFVNFESDEYVVSTKLMVLRVNESVVFPKFIYQYLTSNKVVKRLHYLAESRSGTFPQITFSEIRELPILLPPVEEQKAIAKTLSVLDQKIDLLRGQNHTLEELAQTLFKRWFVEFEFPNENGQPYKNSGGKMVESELGKIPEGWRVGRISDFVRHSTKSISPSKEPEKSFSHYSIPAFDSGRYPTIDFGKTILSNKYQVLENSILVSKLNPKISRVWTIFKQKQNAICSTEIQVFIPNENIFSFSFGLFHYSRVKREMAQRASGTSSSHQRVRPRDILNIEFVVPKMEILKKFEKSILGMLKEVENNTEEIHTLTQLRDTLLPKLMSGELRVKMSKP